MAVGKLVDFYLFFTVLLTIYVGNATQRSERCTNLATGDFNEYFELYAKLMHGNFYKVYGFFTVLDQPLRNGFEITAVEGDPDNAFSFDFVPLLIGLEDKRNSVVMVKPKIIKLDGHSVTSYNFDVRENFVFTFKNYLFLNSTHFLNLASSNGTDDAIEPTSKLLCTDFNKKQMDDISNCFDWRKKHYCAFSGMNMFYGERRLLAVHDGWAIDMYNYERHVVLYQLNNTKNCYNIPWNLENAVDRPPSLIPLLKIPFINSDSPLMKRFRPKTTTTSTTTTTTTTANQTNAPDILSAANELCFWPVYGFMVLMTILL